MVFHPGELFVIATGISFLGSLQLGPVNSEVLRLSIRGKRRSALFTGIGGAMPEIPYALLAAVFAGNLLNYPKLQSLFFWLFISVLLFLAGRLILKKAQPFDAAPPKQRYSPFLLGFILASLNPQLIFFWAGVWIALSPGEATWEHRLAFSLGASFGAFLLQWMVTVIGVFLFRKAWIKNLHHIDRIVGVVLALVALILVLQKIR